MKTKIVPAEEGFAVDPEIKLGKDTFKVTPMPAMRSFTLQPRIFPAVAEALGALASAESIKGALAEGNLLDADLDLNALAKGVAKFCAAMPPKELEFVTRELLATATMNNQLLFDDRDRFNTWMMGRTVDTWKLLAHAIAVNFPDFFALVRGGSVPGEAKGNRSED